MKRKLFSAALTLFALSAYAQNMVEFSYGDIIYTVLDADAKTVQTKPGTIEISYESGRPKFVVTAGNNVSGDLVIPSSVINEDITYTVVKIGDDGFTRCSLSSVTLPSTLTEIGISAFTNVTSLTSIEIPEGVTTLGTSAFASCTDLQNVVFPASLTAIPQNAFSQCGALAELNLPENLSSIGMNAFLDCQALTSLTLPATVVQIGNMAFSGCPLLKTVTVNNPVPPSISSSSFSSLTRSGTLYVPNPALETYKGNQLWSAFANILPIHVTATEIALDKPALTLYAGGQSAVLYATLTPSDANGTVTWSSSNEDVATVDETGRVKGLKAGEATVTASVDNMSATCQVTVLRAPATLVEIKHLDSDLYVGGSVALTAVVYPEEADQTIVWTSSNEAVATIGSATGVLQGVSPGETVVTATAGDVYGTLIVNVLPVMAESITLDPTSLTLFIGENGSLTATISPENVTDGTIIWTSNDDNIVTVVDGMVTAVGVGSAAITAACGNVTAVCPVTVNAIEATGVTLDASTLALVTGQTHQLIATVEPANTTNPLIEWTTSAEGVATVSTDGIVTAVSAGTATITAICGTASAVCEVTVANPPASGIVLDASAISLKAEQSQQLTATVYPENAADKTVTWSVSDATVASVSSDGLVTALKVGTTVVTATAGTVSATCDVTVVETPAESISLDYTTLTVNKTATSTLIATIYPANTTNPEITWTSDNEKVATVADGIVTGVAPGTANITASCGTVSALCAVTVLSPATSITLNETQIVMAAGLYADLIATVDPEDTTDLVEWSSSDDNVATVNYNGIVTAIAPGEAMVTAKAGDQTATCAVQVLPHDDVMTSVEQIKVADNGRYVVYDLKGLHILTSDNISDIRNLPAGLYIVNGQKLLVTK